MNGLMDVLKKAFVVVLIVGLSTPNAAFSGNYESLKRKQKEAERLEKKIALLEEGDDEEDDPIVSIPLYETQLEEKAREFDAEEENAEGCPAGCGPPICDKDDWAKVGFSEERAKTKISCMEFWNAFETKTEYSAGSATRAYTEKLNSRGDTSTFEFPASKTFNGISTSCRTALGNCKKIKYGIETIGINNKMMDLERTIASLKKRLERLEESVDDIVADCPDCAAQAQYEAYMESIKPPKPFYKKGTLFDDYGLAFTQMILGAGLGGFALYNQGKFVNKWADVQMGYLDHCKVIGIPCAIGPGGAFSGIGGIGGFGGIGLGGGLGFGGGLGGGFGGGIGVGMPVFGGGFGGGGGGGWGS